MTDLRRWTDGPLEDAYAEAMYLQAKLESAGDEFHSVLKGVRSEGLTADALRGALYSLRYDADVAESALTRLMQALNTAAEAVEQIALQVEATDARIVDNYLVIDALGNISLSEFALESRAETQNQVAAGVPDPDTVYVRASRARPLLQDTVDDLLTTAEETRQNLSRDLAVVEQICRDRLIVAEAAGTGSSPTSRRDIEKWIGSDPAAVRAAWDSLSKSKQDELLAKYPELLGNLAGIPFAIRKLANDQNMQAFVDEVQRQEPNLDEELQRLEKEVKQETYQSALQGYVGYVDLDKVARLHYLQDLAAKRDAAKAMLAGDGAVKFDPANDSIIAVSGDLTKNPNTVVNYVPGTGTDFGSYANGITDFPSAVARRLGEDNNSTIAFTVKDGPWSTWAGDGSNWSPKAMAKRGTTVIEFQELIQLEDYGSSTKTVAIGHSAGLTKVSSAEEQGMVVDEVISAAGSYFDPNWLPNPNTEYTHIQYKNDAINVVDITNRTPHLSDVFNHKTLEPDINNNGFDGHTRITRGLENNEPGIDAFVDEIMD